MALATTAVMGGEVAWLLAHPHRRTAEAAAAVTLTVMTAAATVVVATAAWRVGDGSAAERADRQH